jgi:hypothetical protein
MQNVNWILAGSYPDPAPCLAKILKIVKL